MRGEVLVLVQRMLDRLKAATTTLERILGRGKKGPAKAPASLEVEKSAGDSDTTAVISYHKEFLAWFLRFLRAQLHPAGAYQRHITALKALLIVAKAGVDEGVDRRHLSKQALGDIKWSFHIPLFNTWLRRNLYELIMNPFDDVRNFAAVLLEMAPDPAYKRELPPIFSPGSAMMTSKKHDEVDAELFKFLCRSEERMLKSGRADHADGVSRTYALLFETSSRIRQGRSFGDSSAVWWQNKLKIVLHLVERLETTIETANTNLSLAVSRFPMHGILASLRLVLFYVTCNLSIVDCGTVISWTLLCCTTTFFRKQKPIELFGLLYINVLFAQSRTFGSVYEASSAMMLLKVMCQTMLKRM
jgi:hypothetical protein